jgi:hypothetical protein
MVDRAKFEFIKEKYGHWTSWAIWAEAGDAPKSNVGDLSIFSGDNFLSQLNSEVILVGLNISRGDIKSPLANFHDARSEATDYKIRYALKDTPFWGGYMTDIIKDFNEKESGKMMSYLRVNKEFEDKNVEIFYEELKDLGSVSPIIIAFGNDAYSILTRNFKDQYRVLKVPHYANYTSKERYREQVQDLIKSIADDVLIDLN